jgi:GTP-binding protein
MWGFMKNKMIYLKSAVFPQDYPLPTRPEIVVAGRSNAGKSSFLNALAGELVAKVSQVPGKTRLLNFFDVSNKYRIVDTPGYGFSRRSGDEQASWQEMLESYFAMRETLCGILLLIDSRREWGPEEVLLANFAKKNKTPLAILLTKCDKLKTSEKNKAVSKMKKDSKIPTVFPVSSRTEDGVEEIEEYFYSNWIKPQVKGGGSL